MKEEHDHIRINTNWTTLIITAAIVLITVLVTTVKEKHRTSEEAETQTTEQRITSIEKRIDDIQEEHRLCSIIGAYTIINVANDDPTEDNVMEFVEICNCWYPDIIMAQYRLESKMGTSDVAKRDNNLFGMKKAWSRKSVRCKSTDRKGYAVYNNWQLSVIDRILWEESVFKGTKPTRQEYLAKIKAIYAEDQNYISKIIKLSEDYKNLRQS